MTVPSVMNKNWKPVQFQYMEIDWNTDPSGNTSKPTNVSQARQITLLMRSADPSVAPVAINGALGKVGSTQPVVDAQQGWVSGLFKGVNLPGPWGWQFQLLMPGSEPLFGQTYSFLVSGNLTNLGF